MPQSLIRIVFLFATFQALAQVPAVQWSSVYGGSGQNSTYEARYRQGGGALVTGTYAAPFSLGSTALSNAGGSDAFLAAFTETGQADWVRRLGGSGDEILNGMTQTTDGDVVVAGQYTAPAVFEGNNLPFSGGTEGFLARLNGQGQVEWVASATNADDMRWGKVATDAAGNVYAFGQFSGTLTLGNNTFTGNTFDNLVLARYSASGQLQWARSWGSGLDDNAYALEVLPNGNIALSADYQGTLVLGSQTLTRKGLSDGVVFVTDTSGNPLWARSIGGRRTDNAFSLTTDAAGNVYSAGTFMDTVQVDNFRLISQGEWDVYAVRFSPSGTAEWARSFGGTANERCNEIRVGPGGQVFLFGWFQNAMELGSQTLQAQGGFDCFVIRLEGDGQVSGGFSFGGTSQDVASAMDVNDQGELLLAGYFFGSVHPFGSQNLNSTTSTAHFLIRTGPLATGTEKFKKEKSALVEFRPVSEGRIEVKAREAGFFQFSDALGRSWGPVAMEKGEVREWKFPSGLYRYRFTGGTRQDSGTFRME